MTELTKDSAKSDPKLDKSRQTVCFLKMTENSSKTIIEIIRCKKIIIITAHVEYQNNAKIMNVMEKKNDWNHQLWSNIKFESKIIEGLFQT